MFDPRLTEEYQQACEPYAHQGADGEIAAMDIGASLWATAIQTIGEAAAITKTRHVGCRWGYSSLVYEPDSPMFRLARATGLTVKDWQNMIFVNQFGRRFWNEVDGSHKFFAAAMAYNGDKAKLNGGGPIWAIFDAEAVAREKWKPEPPHVDPDGYFYSADTIAELAARIKNPHQKQAISGAVLQEQVNRYNQFVADGADKDFEQADPDAQDRDPAVLRRVGDADPARLAHGAAHQHRLAGDRHPRRGDRGPVLRRRIAGRLRPARPRALHRVRPPRRAARGEERCLIQPWGGGGPAGARASTRIVGAGARDLPGRRRAHDPRSGGMRRRLRPARPGGRTDRTRRRADAPSVHGFRRHGERDRRHRADRPPSVGEHVWRIVLPAHAAAGVRHEQCALPVRIRAVPHATSLAVWAVPAAVAAGARFSVKAGAKSSGACDLAGSRIEICDAAGAVLASGCLGAQPWPGSEALHFAELTLTAPPREGLLMLSARFAGAGATVPHEAAASEFSVAVVRPPEHRLRVKVVACETADPIGDADIRVGAERAVTDASGVAEIGMGAGRYQLVVWKAGYQAPPTTVEIGGDAFVQVEVAALPEEDPDARWKM